METVDWESIKDDWAQAYQCLKFANRMENVRSSDIKISEKVCEWPQVLAQIIITSLKPLMSPKTHIST